MPKAREFDSTRVIGCAFITFAAILGISTARKRTDADFANSDLYVDVIRFSFKR